MYYGLNNYNQVSEYRRSIAVEFAYAYYENTLSIK